MLRERIPRIPVPLAHDDPDVTVDLQSIFERTYERAGYDYALDYTRPVVPAPSEAESEWVASILRARDSIP